MFLLTAPWSKAAANEAGVKIFSVRPSDILSKYQGESERYLRMIRDKVPANSIIFFDG
jgi:SpoVK/Ycf46/Vps4 family AAA+-type ATPase